MFEGISSRTYTDLVTGEFIFSASNDSDNGPDVLSYTWSFVSVGEGSSLTNADIVAADTVSSSFTPDVAGSYVLELEVFDGEDSDFDNVAITVIGLPRRT